MQHTCVLAIASSYREFDENAPDLVDRISGIITPALRENCHIVTLSNPPHNLDTLKCELHPDAEIPDLVFSVCHGNGSENTFYAIAEENAGAAILTNQYFQRSGDRRYQAAIFFSCHSNRILSSPEWNELFDRWIAFDGFVWFNDIIEFEATIPTWDEMFKEMAQLLADTPDGQELGLEIQTKMMALSKRAEGIGDVVTANALFNNARILRAKLN